LAKAIGYAILIPLAKANGNEFYDHYWFRSAALTLKPGYDIDYRLKKCFVMLRNEASVAWCTTRQILRYAQNDMLLNFSNTYDPDYYWDTGHRLIEFFNSSNSSSYTLA